mgnify:CR=1 FL=1
MKPTEQEEIDRLLGKAQPEMQRGGPPAYLAPMYVRLSAARALGERATLTQPQIAALLRAALSDAEDEVRKAAFAAIIQRCEPLREIMLLVLTQDADEDTRELALDEALKLGDDCHDLVLKIASVLSSDRVPHLSERAAKVLALHGAQR